jgi:hypothetical protein
MTKILTQLFFGFAFIIGLLLMQNNVEAAGQYSLTPSTGTYYVGRQFETKIIISADQATTAADIKLSYNACKLDVVDSNASLAGVQIFAGNIYNNYPSSGNIVTVSGCNGLIKLTGFVADPLGVLQGGGSGVFGAVRFFVKDVDLAGSVLDIQTTGFGPTFTLDSNISDTSGIDMLSAASDGSNILRLDKNVVPDGDDKPYFDNLSPANNASGVPIGSDIMFRANDNEAGVDFSTLSASISINGGTSTTYNNNSAEVTRNCTTSNYDAVPSCTYIINPSANLPFDANICVTLTINDLSRAVGGIINTANSSTPYIYCFHTLYDTIKPYTINNLPNKNSSGIATNTPLTFDIKDDETGVDIASLIVSINGTNYPYTYTGTPNNYSIILTTLPIFVESQTITINLVAKDRATQLSVPTPNILNETYTLKTRDTAAPFVDLRIPANFSAFATPTTPIIFHIKDLASGVNINSVSVILSNGLVFKVSGANIFSYSGTNLDYIIAIQAPSSGWPTNSPIAIAIFAKDNDGNYLDADVYAVGTGGIQIVTSEIFTTIINTVQVDKNIIIAKNIIDAIYKSVTPSTTINDLVNIISEKTGILIDKDLKEKINNNVQIILDKRANSINSASITEVNNNKFNGSFTEYEGKIIKISGVGEPNAVIRITISGTNIVKDITVSASGIWETELEMNILGYRKYDIIGRIVIDGKEIGNTKSLGSMTIIPWWWTPVGTTFVIVIATWLITARYQINKYKLLEKTKLKKNKK